MMKAELQKAFNKQINEELYSAYLYTAMINYFELENLGGFASWVRAQTIEELAHTSKLIGYLHERGVDVKFGAIAKPTATWKNTLTAFEAIYKHECHISACINKLYGLALKLDDHAAAIFLTWFVNEQVEEEANASEIVQQLKLAKDTPGPMFMLNRELGARAIAFPAAPATE
ncbi:MAG: ferritin [Candidatus Hydrogenedentes bacterium]|nr:ferritin [Candidatus Hydrogenedentota bacterium]